MGAPKFTPKTPIPSRAPSGGRGGGGGGGSGMDELAFLKSVTGEEGKRRQVGSRKPDAPAAETPAEPPADASGAGKAAAPATAAKTLKCGECGTLNRPTEWYCERCGAELAAL